MQGIYTVTVANTGTGRILALKQTLYNSYSYIYTYTSIINWGGGEP